MTLSSSPCWIKIQTEFLNSNQRHSILSVVAISSHEQTQNSASIESRRRYPRSCTTSFPAGLCCLLAYYVSLPHPALLESHCTQVRSSRLDNSTPRHNPQSHLFHEPCHGTSLLSRLVLEGTASYVEWWYRLYKACRAFLE
jgi:hypothetical protein